jgi:membrane fusion protein, copper/silver efflux system
VKKTILYVLILMAVFGAGVLVSPYLVLGSTRPAMNTTANKLKISHWVAPMDPNYRRDKPGKSPMGMELVPVYADDAGQEGTVKISANVENNLGVKIETVKHRNLSRVIDTVGYVTVDENNIDHVHTYADGWIKMLKVKTTGELVQKGALLLKLYSPTLNNAQEELLLALKNNSQGLLRAGEKKLMTLGMPQKQIDELKRTKHVTKYVNINATRSGIVSRLNVREGKFVKPATDLMTIEDLSFIWIIAEVFERQAGWVKAGQDVIATLPYVPRKTWQGTVDYVYPELDPKTHTLRVRLAFPNPDLTMKPNMYANINIHSQRIEKALAIPRSALIRTGEGDRVILALGNGRYKTQGVKLGIESGDYYQILSGVNAGCKIVISAQFLIDSESNLKAELTRISEDSRERDYTSPEEFVGMGVVMKVDKTMRKIVLKHQPIPSLNMPVMEMGLSVDTKLNLNNVKPGDEIHFVIVKQDNNQYRLIKIHAKGNHHDKSNH